MSPSLEIAIRDLLEEGLTDWVPLDRIIGIARELTSAGPADFREIVSDLLLRLVGENLMVPGTIGPVGFEAWPGSIDDLIQRIIMECQSYDWQPLGAGCWMENTAKGDHVARAN